MCAREDGREKESELFGVYSYKTPNPVGSGAYPYDLINLNYFLRGSLSKSSHTEGLGLQHMNSKFKIWVLRGTQILSI